MRLRDKLLWGAVALHLAIAAVYASHFRLEERVPGALERALSIYGTFSGTRSRFDYFAPTVPPQGRADFVITPAEGPPRRVRLARTASDEANHRLAVMFTLYAFATERQNLLVAWADYVLRLHPDAVAVEVRFEQLHVPTMRESAAGQQPQWREVGRTTVRRGAGPGS